MHKKLATDLMSLAHSILKMKRKEEVLELKEKAYQLYEKLCILAYVDQYISTTPNAELSKEELLGKIAKAEEQKQDELNSISVQSQKEGAQKKEDSKIIPPKKTNPMIIKTTSDTLKTAGKTKHEDSENTSQNNQTENTYELNNESNDKDKEETNTKAELKDKQYIAKNKANSAEFSSKAEFLTTNKKDSEQNAKVVDKDKEVSIEQELENTLPVDAMLDLFKETTSKKSLNDYFQNSIQIGLNDRIAFVEHLFNGKLSDYKRVVSQLNSYKTAIEAKKFIENYVEPDYNWNNKEEYVTRLFEIIDRRFA
ncbi:MAG: hypothetical protein ACK5H1_08630 [Tenacibaculum sp.]